MTDQTIRIRYTNWRGEIANRTIRPIRIWFGSTEWHIKPQWLMEAYDVEKDANRDFALADMVFPAAMTPVNRDREPLTGAPGGEALLPCPFCGGKAEWKSGGPGCAWVSCKDCVAETGDGSAPRVAAAWNRRALIPRPAEPAPADVDWEQRRWDAMLAAMNALYTSVGGGIRTDAKTLAADAKLFADIADAIIAAAQEDKP